MNWILMHVVSFSVLLLIHKIIYLVYLLCDAVPLLIFPEAQPAQYKIS